NRKGEHRHRLQTLIKEGYARVRIDGVVRAIEDVQRLAKHKKHTIEVVVDRLIIKAAKSFRKRLTDSVETTLKLGRGRLIVHILGGEEILMSEARTCCGIAYPEPQPALVSFNSPLGMCPQCNGIGNQLSMDIDKLIPDKALSIREGAVVPWRNYFHKNKDRNGSWGGRQLAAMEQQWGIDFDTPWKQLPKKHRRLLLNGSNGREMTVDWDSEKIQGKVTLAWEGLVNTMMRRYRQTQSEHQKKYYAGFMSSQPCRQCRGRRLKPEVLHVRIGDQSIIDVTDMTIGQAHDFLGRLTLDGNRKLIAAELIKEIVGRLGFLLNVGLDYLTLSRKGPSLS
ncbi:MAG: excinuclease ABC subunit UvrA, partial [Shimia sp.]|nr:excinuclease ABC subunit UvrA [Shimia sp.]